MQNTKKKIYMCFCSHSLKINRVGRQANLFGIFTILYRSDVLRILLNVKHWVKEI